MANQPEKELPAVFDLLKVSISKADPVQDKSQPLTGLAFSAVTGAVAAGELSGNADELATVVCTGSRYLTGGLLVKW